MGLVPKRASLELSHRGRADRPGEGPSKLVGTPASAESRLCPPPAGVVAAVRVRGTLTVPDPPYRDVRPLPA